MATAPTLEEIEYVASLTLHDPAHARIPLIQTRHRFDIISKWDIPKGAQVLELGCGQGDCTAVLAHIVGPSGHVTAVDPGPIDSYGSPYTLAQAQDHLSKGPLGPRITWVEADPIHFLRTHPDAKYDYAVLANCIWYFPLPTTLYDTLRALESRVARVAISEWALSASSPAAMPHVLAAFAQASLHPHLPDSSSNVRTMVAPAAIKAAAAQAGLVLRKEELLFPTVGLQDGGWEVAEVKAASFAEQVEANVKSERERAVIYAMRDAVVAGAEALKSRGEKIVCMDVWTGMFVPT